jgi:hypothetical protein
MDEPQNFRFNANFDAAISQKWWGFEDAPQKRI